MMAPLFSSRERTLAVVALTVMGACGFVSAVGWPLWNQLTQLTQQTAVAQKRIIRLRELVRRRPGIEQLYQSYAALRGGADSADRMGRTFLDELEQLAHAANLQLNLKPKPLTREGDVSLIAVEVEVDASQEALLAFLDRILALPRLIRLERVRLASSASKDYPIRATLLLEKVLPAP